MKESILDFILCPKCNGNRFDLKIEERDSNEIREGVIECKNRECNHKMRVCKGTVDCLYNLSKIVIREIKENDVVAYKRRKKDERWLLKLPLSDNFGNEKCMDINKGYLDNVHFITKKVSLKGKRLLDIGAGTCWTTNIFSKKGANAVATDISTKKFVGLYSADVFIRRNKTYFERVLCSMDRLNFRDETFDIIVSNAAVHHSPDVSKTFSEIRRLLRKGGSYVQINEPVCSIFSASRRIDVKRAKKAGMDIAEGSNEQIFSYSDYKRLLKINGLKWQLSFPPSFDRILSKRLYLGNIIGYKRIVGLMVSSLWRFEVCRSLFIVFFPLSLHLFGGTFILIAKKTD